MFSRISTGPLKAGVIAVAAAALIGGIYWGVGSRLDEREEPFFQNSEAFALAMQDVIGTTTEYAARGVCLEGVGDVTVDESDRAALETLLAMLRIERTGRTDVKQQTVVLGCPPARLLAEPPPESARELHDRVSNPPGIRDQDELHPASGWVYVIDSTTFSDYFGTAPWIVAPEEMLCSGHSCGQVTTGFYLPDTATADDIWRAFGGVGDIHAATDLPQNTAAPTATQEPAPTGPPAPTATPQPPAPTATPNPSQLPAPTATPGAPGGRGGSALRDVLRRQIRPAG